MAEECGWPYTGEALPIVYEQARKHLGSSELNDLLAVNYKECKPVEWQRSLSRLYWYRIYTTNIDDVIENAFVGGCQKLQPYTYPCSYVDHDPWFEYVQCIHLHGSVSDFSKGFTFTMEEFASQTAKPNPWYQALVDDMQQNSFIFVGTKLTEPMFYHYLSLRSERQKGTPEFRAKAYLVVPHVSPIQRRQLADQGIVVVEGTGEEFFQSLATEVQKLLPSRVELLKNRYPHQIETLSLGVLDEHAELLRQFEQVTSKQPATGHARTFFFEGAEPTWEDISNNVDAKREVLDQYLSTLRGMTSGVASFVLVGHAGSGKSTMLRRLGFELAREGHAVYFLKSPQKINLAPLIAFLNSIGDRHVYVFVDDVMFHVGELQELGSQISNTVNVTFVLADRPHIVLPHMPELSGLCPKVAEIPPLIREDCERIIDKLKEFGRLGALQGKRRSEQLAEFLGRSKRQLLVAMKEATLGKGFDVILSNEFQSLASDQARFLYTITCLAYMHGAPTRRRHLRACIDGSDIEKASIFKNELREVVVEWKDNEDLLCPRHRVIASQVAKETAPFQMKKDAIIAFLTQISADVTPQSTARRSPEYVAHRGMLNFDNLLEVLGEDYDTIASVFEDVKSCYPDNFLFWLQYGRAELFFDHFAAAENYLRQSLGIRDNYQAWHQMGVLYLKRANFQESDVAALADAREGEDILRKQIIERGDIDAYPYAALIVHKLKYLRRHRPIRADELDELLDLAISAMKRHGLDPAVKDAYDEVYREYLMQAVKPAPELPASLTARVGRPFS